MITNWVVVLRVRSPFVLLNVREVWALRTKEDMNKALVAKMAWEIASNADKWWVKVFQKKYVKNIKFYENPSAKSSVLVLSKYSCLQRCLE